MVIDSDEYLQKIDLAGLEKMITEHPDEVGKDSENQTIRIPERR